MPALPFLMETMQSSAGHTRNGPRAHPPSEVAVCQLPFGQASDNAHLSNERIGMRQVERVRRLQVSLPFGRARLGALPGDFNPAILSVFMDQRKLHRTTFRVSVFTGSCRASRNARRTGTKFDFLMVSIEDSRSLRRKMHSRIDCWDRMAKRNMWNSCLYRACGSQS